MSKIWQHPTLNGCYLEHKVEPTDQVAVNVDSLALEGHVYGIADIPNAGQCCCLTFTVREDRGIDWLGLGIPMGSLAHILPVGAYPFDDGTDLAWRGLMEKWLYQVAQSCFEYVPFQLGLIGHEVSGETCAAILHRDGIPSQRWFGYLWPENEGLSWFAPTEGASFSIGDKRV